VLVFTIVLAPILRYEGWFLELSSPITNFGVKMDLIIWGSIVLNRAAILFDRTHIISEIWASSCNMSSEVNDESSSL